MTSDLQKGKALMFYRKARGVGWGCGGGEKKTPAVRDVPVQEWEVGRGVCVAAWGAGNKKKKKFSYLDASSVLCLVMLPRSSLAVASSSLGGESVSGLHSY